jgi:hypothetical protein
MARVTYQQDEISGGSNRKEGRVAIVDAGKCGSADPGAEQSSDWNCSRNSGTAMVELHTDNAGARRLLRWRRGRARTVQLAGL